MNKYKLLCFPHAGGSGAVYFQWASMVKSCVKVVGVEYPGRGRRFNEKLCSSMSDLVDDLYDKLIKRIDGDDYAVFGHSLGTLVAYEFVCKALEKGYKLPVHMFLSGCNPPTNERHEEIIHTRPDHEFLEVLINSGGMTDEVIANKEILDLFLPIIKNDYRIYETYISKEIVLPVNMTILAGENDTIAKLETINRWTDFTTKNCEIHKFKGGHFYINDNIQSVMDLINNVFMQLLESENLLCLTKRM
jgi:medium-chain acyl-[acyl-carrier-protein] hydrolase